MGIIIKKFGGTSVADALKLMNVAKIIEKSYVQGHKVVVIVSAQAGMTDKLINMAYEIDSNPSKRELDSLMATGEQISISLLAMTLKKLGIDSISLTGWQAGFRTCSNFNNAKIVGIYPQRIEQELKLNKIVVVAGFQGIDDEENITTLGRGGSDTSAVALSAALKADECQIYTDVDGVYTADPNIVEDALKFKQISYDDMILFSSLGAKVLNKRSVETAKKYNIKVNVLSSFEDKNNTFVCENQEKTKNLVKGISNDKNLLFINMTKISNNDIVKIINVLNTNNISIKNVCQKSTNSYENSLDLSFLVSKTFPKIIDLLNSLSIKYKFDIFLKSNVSKISVILGEEESQINTYEIIISKLKDIEIMSVFIENNVISVVVPSENEKKSIKILHSYFSENKFLPEFIS